MSVDLSGERIVVVGLGRSGMAAARLCARLGADVVATDIREFAQLTAAVTELPAQLLLGGHAGVDFARADRIVVSPGVPDFPELVAAEASGVEVIGELELGLRACGAPIVVVGGTNGKSTTTVLLSRMLGAAHERVFAGGNLGQPLSEVALESWDVVLLEVSSFQLERAPSLHPRVSILLNVTDDHLDRYPDFDAYARTKGNAFVRQGAADYAVVPHGDVVCAREARRGNALLLEFGSEGDYRVVGEAVVERATGQHFSLTGSPLHGHHNRLNAAAAIAGARALGLEPDAIQRGLERFEPLGHRMAKVGSWRGISYYDDSKATNVGAAVTAVLGLDEARCVPIVGGRDKWGDYGPLAEALRRRGRAVVTLGEAAPRIERALADILPWRRATSMVDAVRLATDFACAGDAVLLSPACSSFDSFASYAERGDAFVAAVRELHRGGA